MRIEHTIKVDFQRPGVRPVVRIVEGDASTRYIVANLYSGGEPFSVGTGVTGVVKYAKSDGHSGVYDTIDKDKATEHAAVVFHDSSKQAVIELAPNISMGFGLVALIVQFVETSGTDILGTFPVDVIVERDPTDGTEAEDYFSYKALDELYAAIDEAEARISTNTQAIRGTERRLDGVDTSITAMDGAVGALDRRVTSLGVDLSHQINTVATDAHIAGMTAEKAVTDAHSAVTIAQLTESQLSIVSGDAAKAMADAAKALAAGQQDITDEYIEAKKSRPTLTVDAFLLEQGDGLYRINADNGHNPYTARVVTDTFGQTHMDVVEYSQSDRVERNYIDSTLITTVSMNVQDGAVMINPETLMVDLATARSKISALQADNVALRNRVDEQGYELDNLIVAGDGKIYSKSVDSAEAYTKIVPANALPNAVLDSIGGHSEVIDGEIVNADVSDVVVRGKNLASVDRVVHPEGVVIPYARIPVDDLDSGIYTLSLDLSEVESYGAREAAIASYTVNGGKEQYLTRTSKTVTANGKITRFTVYASDVYARFTGTVKVQIERGTNSSEWVPYVSPISNPVPQAIRDLPGYGWSAGSVYNEVDYKNRQFIQRVGMITLTGSDVTSVSEATTGIKLATFSKNAGQKSGTLNVVDNYGDSATGGAPGDSGRIRCLDNRFVRYDNAYTDIDTARALLDATPLTVLYELATTIITDISGLIPTNFEVLPVEDSGTVAFRQAGGTTLPVPSTITFPVKIGGDSV